MLLSGELGQKNGQLLQPKTWQQQMKIPIFKEIKSATTTPITFNGEGKYHAVLSKQLATE